MSKKTDLAVICELLGKKYGPTGEKAAERLKKWLSGGVPYAHPEMLQEHLSEQHVGLLFDAFWQVLPFGTGGRRGRVGYGSNRLNPTTVAMTIQGHCIYLNRVFPKKANRCVVVANDVRLFKDIAGVYKFLPAGHPLIGVSSRSLAKLAAKIYAANGFTVYLAEPASDTAVLSTPELSFVISELNAIGGINLSASHNPPDDNGVKVYDEFGSQPIAPNDQLLVEAMEQATEIRTMEFEEAMRAGLIRGIPAELHEKYIDTYIKLYGNVHQAQADIPIVYTPLCGCGLSTAGDVLSRLNFPVRTPQDQLPDGTFSVIPFKAPNPEVPQATEPAKRFAESQNATIVLASDPDADRIGLEVRLADGSWFHMDGNQIATVLAYFLMIDPEGPRRKGLVVETLVTTKILGKIVEKAGDSLLIDDLLVGFKYVAEVLKQLKRNGRYRDIVCDPSQLVLAAEESHGVIVVPTIRDKDATPACMYLAALHQKLQRKGRNILDYYIQILEEFAGNDTVNRSIMMTGAEGMIRKDRILEILRKSPPKVLGGQPVRKIVDYWDETLFGPFVSETDKLPRNVLQIFTDRLVITVRPSGTEPKLKFYCQLLPEEKPPTAKGMALLQQIREKADAIALVIYNDLLSLIGVSLGQPGLLLPDIIDLDCKEKFDKETVPQLRKAIADERFATRDELLTWLRSEAACMTPGADPLPALKGPLAYLLREPFRDLAKKRLFVELEKWAAS